MFWDKDSWLITSYKCMVLHCFKYYIWKTIINILLFNFFFYVFSLFFSVLRLLNYWSPSIWIIVFPEVIFVFRYLKYIPDVTIGEIVLWFKMITTDLLMRFKYVNLWVLEHYSFVLLEWILKKGLWNYILVQFWNKLFIDFLMWYIQLHEVIL